MKYQNIEYPILDTIFYKGSLKSKPMNLMLQSQLDFVYRITSDYPKGLFWKSKNSEYKDFYARIFILRHDKCINDLKCLNCNKATKIDTYINNFSDFCSAKCRNKYYIKLYGD